MATRQSVRPRARAVSSEGGSSDATLPQKKRARHRLIGAIALCLAASIVVPLLLDPEPSQTNSELDLLIPSRHLSGAASPGPKESASDELGVVESGGTAKAIAALDAAAEHHPVTPHELSPVVEGSQVADLPAPGSSAPSASVTEPKALRTEPKALRTESVSRAGGDEIQRLVEAAAARSRSDSARARHVLQVGAYASESAAKVAVEKVQATGLRAFTERIKTDRGDRIRVRVGPYSSRDAAEQARNKLSAVGIETAVIAP